MVAGDIAKIASRYTIGDDVYVDMASAARGATYSTQRRCDNYVVPEQGGGLPAHLFCAMEVLRGALLERFEYNRGKICIMRSKSSGPIEKAYYTSHAPC